MYKFAPLKIIRAAKPSFMGRVRLFQTTVAKFNEPDFDPEGTMTRLKANPKILPFVAETLDQLKFKALTKVQDQTIGPAIDAEKGLVVRAKTGTGKTLAFLIPMLNQLFPGRTHSLKTKNKVFHLVIVPTRDLALQIERELELFCKGHPELKTFLNRIDVMTGGKRSYLESKFSPSIVIATPGRLLATLRGRPRLSGLFRDLRTLVLDEADRLLDKGFREDLELIDEELKKLNIGPPKGEDTTYKYMLYSATIDDNVQSFAQEKINRDFQYIDCVDKEDTEAHENINQVLVKTKDVNESIHAALGQCITGVQEQESFKSIVFLPTIRSVDWFFSTLRRSLPRPLSRKVFKVTGQMTQAARDRSLLGYRRSHGGVLICTDVAARGLDFPDINTVIQVSPSVETASYIHKIGRTGRAGKKGEAIQYCTKGEEKYIKALQSEKQIEFNETREYTNLEADKELMNYEQDEDVYFEACRSLQLYYFQVNSTYNLNRYEVFKGVLNFHRTVTDSEELLPTDPKMINLSGLGREEATEVFDVPSGFNNFSRKGNNNRNNNNRNSKSQRFGNDRGGNRGRGGYQNREKSYGSRDGGSYGSRDGGSYGKRDGGRDGGYGGNRERSYGGNREKNDYNKSYNDRGSRGGSNDRRGRY